MNKKQKMSIAATGVALVLFAVTAVTASAWAFDTPLYVVRMEKASSKMHFLPTAVTEFTFTTEKGYNLDYCAAGSCGVIPLSTTPYSTCETCDTCWTCPFTVCTCLVSCGGTCEETCPDTCPETCPDTCPYTCDDPTCPDTCEHTCWYTCEKPCIP